MEGWEYDIKRKLVIEANDGKRCRLCYTPRPLEFSQFMNDSHYGCSHCNPFYKGPVRNPKTWNNVTINRMRNAVHEELQ